MELTAVPFAEREKASEYASLIFPERGPCFEMAVETILDARHEAATVCRDAWLIAMGWERGRERRFYEMHQSSRR